MELQDAITAYREQIKHVLSLMDPAPTEEWVATTADALMAPFESHARAGTDLSPEDGLP